MYQIYIYIYIYIFKGYPSRRPLGPDAWMLGCLDARILAACGALWSLSAAPYKMAQQGIQAARGAWML